MLGEWCYFNKYFSAQECAQILELGLQQPSKDATLGVEGNFSSNETRRSKIRFIEKQSQPQFEFLFDKLWKLASIANNDWFNFHLSKIDYLQLAEYDASYKGEYKSHVDVFWMNKDPQYHRKLTCIVQLTDPSTYEGGDFEIYNVEQQFNKEDVRQQGTVIFIPSFIWHAALPVTKGTRYSIAAWFDGPKWK
jgi:PKHD-type hydroxylase